MLCPTDLARGRNHLRTANGGRLRSAFGKLELHRQQQDGQNYHKTKHNTEKLRRKKQKSGEISSLFPLITKNKADPPDENPALTIGIVL